MVANIAYRRGSTSACGTRGSACVLLAHLRRTTIVVRFTFATTTGKRRTVKTWLTAAYRDVVDHLTFGILTARAGLA